MCNFQFSFHERRYERTPEVARGAHYSETECVRNGTSGVEYAWMIDRHGGGRQRLLAGNKRVDFKSI